MLQSLLHTSHTACTVATAGWDIKWLPTIDAELQKHRQGTHDLMHLPCEDARHGRVKRSQRRRCRLQQMLCRICDGLNTLRSLFAGIERVGEIVDLSACHA